MSTYIGRFAPSPSGDLHLGSLIAAVASYLQARVNQGLWLVRIEDLDPPREVAGSAERILQDLVWLGMRPDRPVSYQSQRHHHYAAAMEQLLCDDRAYWCGCTRKQLPDSGVYPGSCREAALDSDSGRTVRLRVADQQLGFKDPVAGTFTQQLGQDVGDFVLLRADGLYAYQLAVVVDDQLQRISEVVRGCDLLDSTPRQIFLQQRLGYRQPDYLHLPLAVDERQRKLSKRTHAKPIRELNPVIALRTALTVLGHQPPDTVDSLSALWAWALQHWQINRIPQHNTCVTSMLKA